MSYSSSFINGFAFPVLIVSVIGVIVASLFYYVGYWLVLQKMGRVDFAALVPVYRRWELARGTGLGRAFSFVYVLFSEVALVLGVVLQTNAMGAVSNYAFMRRYGSTAFDSSAASDQLREQLLEGNPLAISFIVACVVFLILEVRVLYGVARSFDHGVPFTLGLIVLPAVFFAVLGCSAKQRYVGPVADKAYRENPRDDWSQLVKARVATFGSNAPLALSLLGMLSGGFGFSLPAFVFCIAGLVMNGSEKDKPLATAKYRATMIIGILGLVITIVVLPFAMTLWSLYLP